MRFLQRRVIVGVAIALWWLASLMWFAQIPLAAPLTAQQRLQLDGGTFTASVGKAEVQDRQLQVTGVGDAYDALQTHAVEIFDASRYATLHYSLVDFPRTMELVFVFRRSDQPDDVHTVSLPSPNGRNGSVDLRHEAEWHGEIIEIGFAEYPVAQSVPAESGFAPFALVEAELWTESWRGALAVAWHDWFAPRSWALLSISALGPDAAARHGRSLVLMMACGIGGSLVLFALIMRRRRDLILRWTILGIAAGWIVLDLNWIRNFSQRHAATRIIYAGKSWQERQALVPDSALSHAAARVREAIGAEDRGVRLIVDAASDYQRARLVYHLLPLNVAPGNFYLYGAAPNLDGTLLVLYALDVPEFDADSAELTYADGHRVGAELLLEEAPLRIYRIHGELRP